MSAIAVYASARSADHESVSELVCAIRREFVRIRGAGNTEVRAVLAVCTQLAALRRLVKGTWSRELQRLDMDTRVASRYLKIAASGLATIGLKESEISRLPADPMKLEWLCRLTREQLNQLLGNLNCRTATRSKVITAVQTALGQPAQDPVPNIERQAGRLVEQMLDLVWRLSCVETDQPDRVRDMLIVGLDRVRAALATAAGSNRAGDVTAAA